MFKITFYKTESGQKPAGEFINGLDRIAKDKVVLELRDLSMFGSELDRKKTKHLVDGLFELRIKDRSNAYRMIYFFVIGNEIIVTNGFTKKTQKTPPEEIEKARKYRNDYLRRH